MIRNITIKKNDLKINFHKFVLLYYFVVYSIPSIRIYRPIYWSSLILVLCGLFFLIIKSKFKMNIYIMWVFVFNFILLSSILWAVNKEYAFDAAARMIAVSIICVYISLLINNINDFYEVLKLFVLSKIIMSFYIVFNIDLSIVGSMRIGGNVLGELWNANTIGMNLSIATLMILLILLREKSICKKIFFILVIIFFLFLTFLTGSRKAFLMVLLGIGGFFLLNSRKNVLVRIVFTVIIVLFIHRIIVNIPIFYNVLGFRIEKMFAVFGDQSMSDHSTLARLSMINYGIDFFKLSPVLGYGINNYALLYGSVTGVFTYSHNNYIELLVGIGLIGFLAYYFMYLYVLKNSIVSKNPFSIFAFLSIVILILIDFGLVSYNSHYIQNLICLSFVATKLGKNNGSMLDNKGFSRGL